MSFIYFNSDWELFTLLSFHIMMLGFEGIVIVLCCQAMEVLQWCCVVKSRKVAKNSALSNMKKTTIVYHHWMLEDLLYCIMLFKYLSVLASTHNDGRIRGLQFKKKNLCMKFLGAINNATSTNSTTIYSKFKQTNKW